MEDQSYGLSGSVGLFYEMRLIPPFGFIEPDVLALLCITAFYFSGSTRFCASEAIRVSMVMFAPPWDVVLLPDFSESVNTSGSFNLGSCLGIVATRFFVSKRRA